MRRRSRRKYHRQNMAFCSFGLHIHVMKRIGQCIGFVLGVSDYTGCRSVAVELIDIVDTHNGNHHARKDSCQREGYDETTRNWVARDKFQHIEWHPFSGSTLLLRCECVLLLINALIRERTSELRSIPTLVYIAFAWNQNFSLGPTFFSYLCYINVI